MYLAQHSYFDAGVFFGQGQGRGQTGKAGSHDNDVMRQALR